VTIRMFMPYAICTALAGPIALFTLNAHAGVSYNTHALKGDQAPGTDPGVVFSVFGTPVLNGTGQIAFTASVSGLGVNFQNDDGLWSEGAGSLSLIGRENFAAPGTPAGVLFNNISAPAFNDAGQTAFQSTLKGTGVTNTNSTGIWSGAPGSLSLLARTDSAAPGAPAGAVFTDLGAGVMLLNNAGQTAFDARLIGTGIVTGTNDRGIWSQGSGSLSVTARTADAAPGTGGVFNQFLFDPVINASGQTAFTGGLAGAGVNASNDSAIWAGGTGSLSLVAREADPAPGTGAGVVFSSNFAFNNPAINDAGQTAFLGFLSGSGVNTANDIGIWSQGSGSLQLVAREGDAAAGMAAGVVYGNTLSRPVINGAGQTAFGGRVAGTGVDSTNNIALWMGDTGSPSLVARSGDPAPGTAAGVVFGSQFFNYVLNDTGQIAFTADVTGPGVFGQGIWATDSAGTLTLVARTGDLFDVNDDPLIDDFRTISLVRLKTNSGGQDGRATSFNDASQLAFRLRFTDNTEGIFVATITAPLSGDLDLDGFVGIADLNILLGNWNQNVPPADPLADPTGDGFVGIADLNIVLGNWNAGTPPSVAVTTPEPASIVLLVVGSSVFLGRRHRPS
jgi:hypothetical protein